MVSFPDLIETPLSSDRIRQVLQIKKVRFVFDLRNFVCNSSVCSLLCTRLGAKDDFREKFLFEIRGRLFFTLPGSFRREPETEIIRNLTVRKHPRSAATRRFARSVSQLRDSGPFCRALL